MTETPPFSNVPPSRLSKGDPVDQVEHPGQINPTQGGPAESQDSVTLALMGESQRRRDSAANSRNVPEKRKPSGKPGGKPSGGKPQRRPDEQPITNQRYVMIALDKIDPHPKNPRPEPDRVDEMAASLRKHGILQPITVTEIDGRYQIQYGERRYAGAKQIGWPSIPAIVRSAVDGGTLTARQLLENLERSDMNPMAIARALRSIMREEKLATHDQLAEFIGSRSNSWVSMHMALLYLDEEDQKAVEEGRMTVATGARISREKQGVTRAPRGRNKFVAHRTPPAAIPRPPAPPSLQGLTIADRAGESRASSGTLSGNRTSAFNPAESPSFGSVHLNFTDEHPLAGRVLELRADHGCRPLPLTTVGCGECWERAIREDAVKGAPIS